VDNDVIGCVGISCQHFEGDRLVTSHDRQKLIGHLPGSIGCHQPRSTLLHRGVGRKGDGVSEHPIR